ncbi:lysylphosphatidylglycerol synthase transmembrane domain-containing protein [Leptothoe spongobia]|uniref:Flippase-like domain-containing protein n=1 Tax=Leptothoe spongobia TAU-MAC 1115 TaxID=1967444 RepID=A0A947GIN7_9CYAN|nr:lysylphosphatidylglycerol synthase transmembrane domain-containing protein [Leptothoe spongobia]MBT9316375.1 flippase-like domain-containing protein [Leptothoe spongobia TAU-MAC 1115]
MKPLTVVKITVSLILIALIVTQVDFVEAGQHIQTLSWPFVAFALLFYTGLQWLSCWRWQMVLKSQGYQVRLRPLMSSYFAGMWLNIFLPGSLGGDVYRVYQVSQRTQDSEAALVSVFLERFTGLAALSAIAVMGLPPAFQLVGRWDIIALFLGAVGALVGAVLLIMSPRLLQWAEPWLMRLSLGAIAARFTKIQTLLHQFAKDRSALVSSMGLSFILQLGIVIYHFLIAQQLAISISFLALVVFIPIVVVITLLPISLGGLGLKEGLWIYLFSRVGLSSEEALLLSLTVTLLGWLLSIPGGIILLLDSAGYQHVRAARTESNSSP